MSDENQTPEEELATEEEYDPTVIIQSMREEYFQSLEQEEDTEPKESVELLSFRIGDQNFALKITEIKGVIRPPRITKLPLSPIHLVGVINLRGEIKPVLNLHPLFHMPPFHQQKSSRILIVQDYIRNVALMVDQILDLYEVYVEDIHPPVHLDTKIRSKFLEGKIELNDAMTLILDIDALLNSEELQVRTK